MECVRKEEIVIYATMAKTIDIPRLRNLPEIYKDYDGSLEKIEALDNIYIYATCMLDADTYKNDVMIEIHLKRYDLIYCYALIS